jgi:hypothetical protein
MKTKLLALVLLAAGSMFAGTRVVVGLGGYGYGYYGAPPPPPVVAYVGPRYAWHAGYFARPPYARAYWVGPRYYGHRYYRGYWRR